MALPLKDYRTGIPEWVDTWLDIEQARTGATKQDIGRKIFESWAKQQIHAHKVATRLLRANGMQPELFGDDAEETGTTRNGRERR